MDLFASIFRFLYDTWDLITPWYILRPWQGGVILRWGKYSRHTRPGWNWIWPLWIERPVSTNITPTTCALLPQLLTTMDGVQVLVSATVLWRVVDVKKYLLEIEEADDILVDAGGGVIREIVSKSTWAQLQAGLLDKEIQKGMRRRAHRWGVRVMRSYIMNLGKSGLRQGALWLRTVD